jgi:hypothetical protein
VGLGSFGMPALKAVGAHSRAVIALFLASCSAHLPPGPDPSDPRELSRYALVIEEMSDGQVTHSWVPSNNFDASQYSYLPSTGVVEGRVVRASFNRDCEEERDRCEEMCKASLKGRNWTHASGGSKAQICRERCRPAYQDCSQLREQADAVKFPVTDKAVDWLKRHREELLVGTIIVIAGVAFAVVVVGSGGTALVLVPAVLLISTEVPSMSYVAEGRP